MLREIERLTFDYLNDNDDAEYDAGLRGVETYGDDISDYMLGLYDGLHFYALLHHFLFNKNKEITIVNDMFIENIDDEDEGPKKEQFMIYITKFMTYNCCWKYVRMDHQDLPEKLELALLERMVYLLKLKIFGKSKNS